MRNKRLSTTNQNCGNYEELKHLFIFFSYKNTPLLNTNNCGHLWSIADIENNCGMAERCNKLQFRNYFLYPQLSANTFYICNYPQIKLKFIQIKLFSIIILSKTVFNSRKMKHCTYIRNLIFYMKNNLL